MVEISRDFPAFGPFPFSVSSRQCRLFIHTDHVNDRKDIWNLVADFSDTDYPETVLDDLDDIVVEKEDEDLPDDLQVLDSITWFWCDVTGFVKVDPTNHTSPF